MTRIWYFLDLINIRSIYLYDTIPLRHNRNKRLRLITLIWRNH